MFLDRNTRFARLAGLVGAIGLGTGTAAAQPLFVDVTSGTGLGGYVASTGDGHGPGGVFADLNNDGFPDLYLVRASGRDGLGDPSNLLFVNVPGPLGNRHFEQVPFSTGAGDPGNATGAIAGDYDNDGDVDLYVTNFDQPNVLLQNQLAQTGSLGFADVTAQTDPTPGVGDGQFGVGIALFDGVPLDNSLTAAWADPDRDGDLDLYVGNHNGFAGSPVEGPFVVPGRRDVFYINNGNGTFTDVTMAAGVPGWISQGGSFQTPNQRFSSSNAVIFADFNNDRWPDLLVTNKVGGPDDRDMLYINLGRTPGGQWRGFATVTYELDPPFGDASDAAMGVDVADIDNDGDLDVYITDWSNPEVPGAPGQNDLWINRLAETGHLWFELSEALPAKFSWGAQWQDFDNDGRLDLHVGTQGAFPDFLYWSTPGGFAEIALLAGVAQQRNSRGDMSADYNRDGWVDLFVVNLDGGPSVLYENVSDARLVPGNAPLTLKLVGNPALPGAQHSSRDAIGARAVVRADMNHDGIFGPGESQTREVLSGSSNAASTSSLELEFGLGSALASRVTILWPSGRQVNLNIAGGVQTVIVEGVDPCPVDFNQTGSPDVLDFFLFVQLFNAGDPVADLTGDGTVNVLDFFAFASAFAACG